MKEVKTNAMRFLDRHKITYEVIQYECDEFVDGLKTADICGIPYEQSFKTLVTEGKSGSSVSYTHLTLPTILRV